MNRNRVDRRPSAGHWPRPAKRRRPDPPALVWAEDVTGLCPRITAVGSRSLLVENHTGIRSFSDCTVVLDSRAGAIRVEGRGLSLGCVRSGALILRGDIRRVELPEGGDAPDEG